MDLFLVPQDVDSSEKVAGTPVRLSDDDARWPQEITAEAYRTFPFLSDADLRVEMTRTDPSAGVGVGRVLVRKASPRMDVPMPDSSPIILPVVIRGGELEPLDIATDGKRYFPATRKRLEEHLLQPEALTVGPNVENLVDTSSYFSDLIPPGRNYHGAYPGGGAMKTGSASLSAALLPYCDDDQLLHMRTAVGSDPTSFLKLQTSVPGLMSKIAEAAPREKEEFDLWSQLPATVFQLEKVGTHKMRVTWANRNAFKKMAQDIPMEQANQLFPEEMLQQAGPPGMLPQGAPPEMQGIPAPEEGMPPGGPEEGAPPPQEGAPPEAPAFSTEAPVNLPVLPRHDPTSPIKDVGEYIVFAPDGTTLSGWGCGRVLNFDGSESGMSVFSNGAISAVQPAIAGARTGAGLLPPTTRTPQGLGCFVVRIDGEIQVYSPVEIQSSMATPDGRMGYVCQTFTGEQLSFQAIPEVRRMSPMGEGVYAMPETYEFLPLQGMTELLQPGQIVKQAQMSLMKNPLYLSCAGPHTYHLEGPPVASLPTEEHMGLEKKAARFLLVTCGVHPQQAEEKLAEAARVMGDLVPLPGLRSIIYGPPVLNSTLQKFAAAKEALPDFRGPVLVKEAAAIAACMGNMRDKYGDYVTLSNAFFKIAFQEGLPEYETVDSVLSLGLVNKDSVDIFCRQKEQLEESLSTLCSLLMFARLGAPNMPEISLERCISAFEDVLESLKVLPFNVK